MSTTEKVDLQMQEDADGSAVVSLPPGESPNESQNRPESNAEPRDDHEDDDGTPEDNTPHADPEREAIRLARREERVLKKKLSKARATESTHLINSLKRQNEQMVERLAVLEKRTAGADVARLDKAIEDSHVRLQYAKHKIKEATEMADGAALADAQEAWYDARRQVEALDALKKKTINDTPGQSVPRSPDPRLKKHAGDWMSRNSWYDPNGGDTDSQIAVKIDEALVREGWDPTSQDYWEELDNRLTKYLPHHYNGVSGERSPERRPRSVVTSSGRESAPSARPNEFRLSPDRVKAIKEAGRWDDPTERSKMIRKYAEYDRNSQNRS